MRRVRDALRLEPVDDLGVETFRVEQLVLSLSIEDEPGQLAAGRSIGVPPTPSTDCASRCVGKIVRPSCPVGTITTSMNADASEPSSSWNASAVS